MVHEQCCRARYRPSRVAKDKPLYICLNKATCRSLVDLQHPVLRGGQRAEPGEYEGVYCHSGKLVAAKSGNRTTPMTVERFASESRESDRAQAEAFEGLKPPGGLLSSGKLVILSAETLASSELDQEVEGFNSGMSGAPNNVIFLQLVKDKIEKLDTGMEKRDQANTTGLQALADSVTMKAEKKVTIILHPPTHKTKASWSTAERHDFFNGDQT